MVRLRPPSRLYTPNMNLTFDFRMNPFYIGQTIGKENADTFWRLVSELQVTFFFLDHDIRVAMYDNTLLRSNVKLLEA